MALDPPDLAPAGCRDDGDSVLGHEGEQGDRDVEDAAEEARHPVEPVLEGLPDQTEVVDRAQPDRVVQHVGRCHDARSRPAVPGVRGVTFQLLSRMTCLTCATRPMTFFHSV